MNRRGFTLIELIVTLALLAVISVISFVAIGGILDKNKNNECDNLVSSIKTAAKEYVSDNRYKGLQPDGNNQIYISAKTLIDGKYLSNDIINNPYDSDEIIASDSITITIVVNDDFTANKVLISNGDLKCLNK